MTFNYPLWFVLMLLTMCPGNTKGMLTQTPSDAVAMVDHYPAYLNCSTDRRPVEKYALWKFYPFGAAADVKIYIYDEVIHAGYENRFSISIDSSSGAFNLVIQRANTTDAGRYECSDDHDVAGASAEVAVLESNWVCESNMDLKGLAGPNDCDEAVAPDKLKLACSVRCIGENFPTIYWRINGNYVNTMYPTTRVRSDANLTYNVTIKASQQLEGSISICQNGTEHCSHVLKVNKVLYAFADTTKRECNTGEEVTCVANISMQLPCSYIWYKDMMPVSSHETFMPTEPGVYRCRAQCLIRNDTCTFTAKVINASESGWNVLLIPLILSVLINIVLVGALIWTCARSKKCISDIWAYVRSKAKKLTCADRLSRQNGVPSINTQNGCTAVFLGETSGQRSCSSNEEQNGRIATLPEESSKQNGESSDKRRTGSYYKVSGAPPNKTSVHTYSSLQPSGRGTPRYRGKPGVGQRTQ